MVTVNYIEQWRENAPWQTEEQIEQDLLLSRTVIAIFQDDFLRENLAFRGGTALHKLYLDPAPRYSEDIDLVQIHPGPIGDIMKRIREVVDFFDQPRKTKIGGHGAKAFYRFETEHAKLKARVKVEINGKEHFHILPWVNLPFRIENGWFTGEAMIRTYSINELLGTKLRALYQRSKGRDIFDLDFARRHANINLNEIVHCFKEYITFSTGKRPPSQAEFLLNLEEKEQDKFFMDDMVAILRKGVSYEPTSAMEWLKEKVVTLL
jgi:predicted nucleotidyltransferase component of viral defense system